jgi:hypothetical protein
VSDTDLIDVAVETSQFCPRKYAAVVCDSDWYTGCIVLHKDQEGDFLLKFMRGKGQDNMTFSWPQGGDKCVFPLLKVGVHFEQHHYMEGVDQGIDLSMLIHSS